jgi:hypothetical protein
MTSTDSYNRLHRSGWSIGSTAFDGPAGLTWVVSGSNGENRIRYRGGFSRRLHNLPGLIAWPIPFLLWWIVVTSTRSDSIDIVRSPDHARLEK